MEGMKRANMVSFLGWTNKLDDYSGMREKNGEADGVLERTGSGMSALSAYGRESDSSCDDLKRKRIKEDDDPGNLHLSQHNRDVISHPNGRLGAPIYQKHQRRTSDEQEYADIAALRFRGVHHAVNNFKPVAEAGYTQKRFLCGGEMGDALQDHSNITAEEKSSSPEKEKSGLGRQHMFDKAVTPSDVGKLNRLVIPKQHAEKYFPLDTNANDKGLLLNFEDNAGKTWRFRYSYWNSSQSYVLTKGWSRFVKEKKLDAGDIVSFERGTDAQNAERLFISWRRRPCALQPSKAALLRGLSLPSSTFPYAAPFQSHALNIRPAMTKLGQARQFKAFPEWMSAVWSANNGGASSRLPPMWAEQPPPQPQPVTPSVPGAEAQNCSREPLDSMQLKTPSWPVENPSVKTSKKGVRLFGVYL